MNLLPVFALLLAQRQGDSTPDAGRAALIAALVRPPLLGFDPASYPHTSGVYNLMISGGEYGSQKGGSAEPSVHE